MPIRYIEWDEWYPVFELREKAFEGEAALAAEFSEEEIARVAAAEREFESCQDVIRQKYQAIKGQKK